MQMTEELEKRLKLMQHFNQVLGDKRSMHPKKKFFFNDKIFVHNNILYATDGHIFVVSSNLTDYKDFSFFKCNNKKFEYMDSSNKEVKEIKEVTKDGKNLENVLQMFNHASVSFDIDFEDCPLPVKLCSSWSKRHRDKIAINLQTEEAIIDFCGGLDSPDGVTVNYGDIIKNVSGELPKNTIRFELWHIMEIMKQCKVKKIHIESNTDKHFNMCKVKDYTFIFTDLV